MTLSDTPALRRPSAAFCTCSAEKLGPLFEPRRMTWHAGLPSVSTTAGVGGSRVSSTSSSKVRARRAREGDALAEMPCFVTERNECDDAAAPMASMAIWSEPSVPFLKPTA